MSTLRRMCANCGKRRTLIIASIEGVLIKSGDDTLGTAGIAHVVCRHCGEPSYPPHGPIFGENLAVNETRLVTVIEDVDARPIKYRVVS